MFEFSINISQEERYQVIGLSCSRYLKVYLILNFSPLGDISKSSAVFKWILEQKADESIELIDRETLFEYINTKDFLAVVFCK